MTSLETFILKTAAMFNFRLGSLITLHLLEPWLSSVRGTAMCRRYVTFSNVIILHCMYIARPLHVEHYLNE